MEIEILGCDQNQTGSKCASEEEINEWTKGKNFYQKTFNKAPNFNEYKGTPFVETAL